MSHHCGLAESCSAVVCLTSGEIFFTAAGFAAAAVFGAGLKLGYISVTARSTAAGANLLIAAENLAVIPALSNLDSAQAFSNSAFIESCPSAVYTEAFIAFARGSRFFRVRMLSNVVLFRYSR